MEHDSLAVTDVQDPGGKRHLLKGPIDRPGNDIPNINKLDGRHLGSALEFGWHGISIS
jgi:hypothetical protein